MGMLFGVHRSCLRPGRKSFRPHAEVMEDRLLLATFTVRNTLDNPNDPNPDSLRYAITQSNLTPGSNDIKFAIPGTGVHTISLTGALPSIMVPVTIDGTTQPGFADTPIIELDGSGAGANADGLTLSVPDITVRGLVINRFSHSGVFVFCATM